MDLDGLATPPRIQKTPRPSLTPHLICSSEAQGGIRTSHDVPLPRQGVVSQLDPIKPKRLSSHCVCPVAHRVLGWSADVSRLTLTTRKIRSRSAPAKGLPLTSQVCCVDVCHGTDGNVQYAGISPSPVNRVDRVDRCSSKSWQSAKDRPRRSFLTYCRSATQQNRRA